ncbi:MAG: hypothetical protein ABIX01_23650 [Chitinophagaceae bacterium]
MKWIFYLGFVISTALKAQIKMAHGQDIGYTIMSADGKTFATVGKRSGTVKVWSSATGSLVKTIQLVRCSTDYYKFNPLPKDSIYLYASTLYDAKALKESRGAAQVTITEAGQTKDGKKGRAITVASKGNTQTYFYEGMTYSSVMGDDNGIGRFILSNSTDSLYSYIIYPGKAPFLYGAETYKTQTLNGTFTAGYKNLLTNKGDFLYNIAERKKVWTQSTPLFTKDDKLVCGGFMADEKLYYAATAIKAQVINATDGKLLHTFNLDTLFFPRGYYLDLQPQPYEKFKNYRMMPLPDLSGYVYAPHTINWSGRDEADAVQAWLVKNGHPPIALTDSNSSVEYAAQKDTIDQYLKKEYAFLTGYNILTELKSIREKYHYEMTKIPIVRRAEADETKGSVFTFNEAGSYLITAYGPTLNEVLLYDEKNKKWINQENLKWGEMSGDYTKWDHGCANRIITKIPNVAIRFILVGRAPVDGVISVVKE